MEARKLARAARMATAALLCATGAIPCWAQTSDALVNALGRDSEVTLNFRTYYFDRQNPGDVTNAAWAIGGWAGYRTGWIGDALRFGMMGYTSQPLWAPLDKTGSGLLADPNDGYSVIGEVYASLRLWDQVLTGGRFRVDQPEINASDIRMTPITYSGGNLAGSLGGVSYYGAYLNATKPRNSENFINFAAAAGVDGAGSEPLWLLGFAGEPMKGLQWELSSYYVPNVLSSTYADVSWLTPLSDTYKLRLGAQAMAQSSVGDNLLTGSSFSTWSGGVKADVLRGGATATLVYQQTGSGYAYQTPYSSWAGYTNMIVKAFDQAGQKAWLLGGTYDFAAQRLPGLVLNGAIVYGWDAINATTRAAQPKWTEYDLTLDYRFAAKTWPEWVRPLWIRGRAAYVDMASSGNIEDYRIIVNYEWVF
jgi:outer membrane porin, OprD family